MSYALVRVHHYQVGDINVAVNYDFVCILERPGNVTKFIRQSHCAAREPIIKLRCYPLACHKAMASNSHPRITLVRGSEKHDVHQDQVTVENLRKMFNVIYVRI